jgi:hypothetical protein
MHVALAFLASRKKVHVVMTLLVSAWEPSPRDKGNMVL